MQLCANDWRFPFRARHFFVKIKPVSNSHIILRATRADSPVIGFSLRLIVWLFLAHYITIPYLAITYILLLYLAVLIVFIFFIFFPRLPFPLFSKYFMPRRPTITANNNLRLKISGAKVKGDPKGPKVRNCNFKATFYRYYNMIIETYIILKLL